MDDKGAQSARKVTSPSARPLAGAARGVPPDLLRLRSPAQLEGSPHGADRRAREPAWWTQLASLRCFWLGLLEGAIALGLEQRDGM